MCPFFTIIIPAYNAEKYLGFAIDSILEQSFKNFELIIVNDGSKDTTLSISKKYEQEYDNIRLIDKKNEGVSAARNDAIALSNGQYLIFVDADDIIYPNALQSLFDILNREPLDYLRFEYQTIDKDSLPLFPNYESKRRKKWEFRNVDAATCILNIIRNEFFSCVGVYKKSIITDNNLRYLNGCTYNEDTLFMMEYFQHSKSHAYISNIIYGYRKIDTAVTAHFSDKNFNDVENVIKKIKLLGNTTDKFMNTAIKKTIETLSLRLLLHNSEQFLNDLPSINIYCKKSPILFEWKIINSFGVRVAYKIFPIINLIKRIIRKINYLF